MNSLDLKKPKLLDLIATLSQNNAELRAKNRANERKRFEHLFPDIPTEDLTMTTEEEGTKKEQTIKPSNRTLPQKKASSVGNKKYISQVLFIPSLLFSISQGAVIGRFKICFSYFLFREITYQKRI